MLDVFNEKARKAEEKAAAEKERQEILKEMDELFVAYDKNARKLDELDKKFGSESEEPLDKRRKLGVNESGKKTKFVARPKKE